MWTPGGVFVTGCVPLRFPIRKSPFSPERFWQRTDTGVEASVTLEVSSAALTEQQQNFFFFRYPVRRWKRKASSTWRGGGGGGWRRRLTNGKDAVACCLHLSKPKVRRGRAKSLNNQHPERFWHRLAVSDGRALSREEQQQLEKNETEEEEEEKMGGSGCRRMVAFKGLTSDFSRCFLVVIWKLS